MPDNTLAPDVPYQQHNDTNQDEPSQSIIKKILCAVVKVGLAIFLFLCIVQGVEYWWATFYCRSSGLEGYQYPAGDIDLIFNSTLLVEQEPNVWGAHSFLVFKATDANTKEGASIGVFTRYRGPFFWTYAFQDNYNKQLFVARDRPISIGGSHKIMRCDGKGDAYVYSEGGHWLMNKVRYFLAMHSTSQYNIWKGSDLVGFTQRVGSLQGNPQLTFNTQDDQPTEFSSGLLQTRFYEHKWDEWQVSPGPDPLKVPAYVTNTAVAIFAFNYGDTPKGKEEEPAKPVVGDSPPHTALLAEGAPANTATQVV